MNSAPRFLDDRRKVTGYFATRFGIEPEVFDAFEIFERGKSFWALSREAGQDPLLLLTRLEYAGMRLLRQTGRYPKPTTYGLQRFGHGARRNRVEVSRETLRALLDPPGGIEGPFDGEDGYVILVYREEVLGCGLRVGGRLRHCFPKSRAEVLRRSGLF